MHYTCTLCGSNFDDFNWRVVRQLAKTTGTPSRCRTRTSCLQMDGVFAVDVKICRCKVYKSAILIPVGRNVGHSLIITLRAINRQRACAIRMSCDCSVSMIFPQSRIILARTHKTSGSCESTCADYVCGES